MEVIEITLVVGDDRRITVHAEGRFQLRLAPRRATVFCVVNIVQHGARNDILRRARIDCDGRLADISPIASLLIELDILELPKERGRLQHQKQNDQRFLTLHSRKLKKICRFGKKYGLTYPIDRVMPLQKVNQRRNLRATPGFLRKIEIQYRPFLQHTVELRHTA